MSACPIAIVGPGTIARRVHVPALASNAAFELVASVGDAECLEGLPAFTSIEALLRDGPPVCAVAICTPPQVRGTLARQSIAAGLHVLLEKPPCSTVTECRMLQAQAQARNVTIFASWHSRFAGMVAKARAWLADKQVVSGEVTWHEDVRFWHPGQTWLWQPGGLGVFDPGINALSILTEINPQPLTLREAYFTVPRNCQAPIAARLALACGTAPIAIDLDFRNTGPQIWSIAFSTSDGGNLLLADGGRTMACDGEAATSSGSDEYGLLYEHFAALIDASRSDCDCRPLQLVADAFLIARTEPTEAFIP